MRIALVRFDVNEQSLRRLLQVTSTLYRRTASEPGAHPQERNSILLVVNDVLSDGLRSKCRIIPSTLKAIVEVSVSHMISKQLRLIGWQSLCKPRISYLPNTFLIRLATDALFYLQIPSSPDLQAQHGLLSSRAASILIIGAECNDKGFLYRYFSENTYEVR